MIGIYKLTNKLTNKSYIGQSIHCGKRLDEHCKGNQLIDSIIQIEGVENYSFEILKEVEKEELSFWEDYYIYKYNTMFPNGYNKKWNCSGKERVVFSILLEKELQEEKKKITEEVKTEKENIISNFYNNKEECYVINKFKDIIENDRVKIFNNIDLLKTKNYKVYLYLLKISKTIQKDNNIIRVVFNKDICLSEMYKIIGSEERTIKKYLNELEDNLLLIYSENDGLHNNPKRFNYRKKNKNGYYVFMNPKQYMYITKEVLDQIFQLQNFDIKIYFSLLILINKDEDITLKTIRDVFDYKWHERTNQKIKLALNKFKELGFLDYDTTVDRKTANTVYKVKEIKK